MGQFYLWGWNSFKKQGILMAKLVVGVNDLASQCPEVAAEWDYEKNGDVTPEMVHYHSRSKFWWICSKHGVGWETSVAVRSKGCGCSQCRSEKISAKSSLPKHGESLAEKYPDIAAEWDYEKNGDVTPRMVSYGSTKKAWWVCPDCGNSYMSSLNSRTTGQGCPKCRYKKVSKKNSMPKPGQSLAEVFPEVAAEWDYEKNGDDTPDTVSPKSGKKVWWLCSKCGTSYKKRLSDQTKEIYKCPTCHRAAMSKKGMEPKSGNSLAEVAPEIAMELHPTKNGDLTAETVSAKSGKTLWWICPNGHEYLSRPYSRVGLHASCPECAGTKVSFPEKAVFHYIRAAFQDAEANSKQGFLSSGKMEVDIWIPSRSTGVEYDGQRWHTNIANDCKKDQACLSANVRLIRIRESGCPDYQASRNVSLVKRSDHTYKSLDDAIVETLKMLEVDEKLIDVDTERDVLEIMSETRANLGKKSFASTHQEIAAEWDYERNDGLRPEMFTYGSARKVWWTCPNGHEPYQARILARSHGSGCPVCGAKRAGDKNAKPKDGNTLKDAFPKIAAEFHPYKNAGKTAEDFSPYSGRKVWWLCSSCGKEWESPVRSRTTSGGERCPECRARHNAHGTQMRLDFSGTRLEAMSSRASGTHPSGPSAGCN